jgi:hypothetical protein
MVQKLLNIEYLFSLKIELKIFKVIEMCFRSCLKVNRILWRWFCARNIEFQIIFLSMEISNLISWVINSHLDQWHKPH